MRAALLKEGVTETSPKSNNRLLGVVQGACRYGKYAHSAQSGTQGCVVVMANGHLTNVLRIM